MSEQETSFVMPSEECADAIMRKFPIFVKIEEFYFKVDKSPIARFLCYMHEREHIHSDLSLQDFLRPLHDVSSKQLMNYLEKIDRNAQNLNHLPAIAQFMVCSIPIRRGK